MKILSTLLLSSSLLINTSLFAQDISQEKIDLAIHQAKMTKLDQINKDLELMNAGNVELLELKMAVNEARRNGQSEFAYKLRNRSAIATAILLAVGLYGKYSSAKIAQKIEPDTFLILGSVGALLSGLSEIAWNGSELAKAEDSLNKFDKNFKIKRALLQKDIARLCGDVQNEHPICSQIN